MLRGVVSPATRGVSQGEDVLQRHASIRATRSVCRGPHSRACATHTSSGLRWAGARLRLHRAQPQHAFTRGLALAGRRCRQGSGQIPELVEEPVTRTPPGSRAGLLPPSPLRTARESFPSSSSSLSNAPCGTRWCHIQRLAMDLEWPKNRNGPIYRILRVVTTLPFACLESLCYPYSTSV
jgi:hypothetical protein